MSMGERVDQTVPLFLFVHASDKALGVLASFYTLIPASRLPFLGGHRRTIHFLQ